MATRIGVDVGGTFTDLIMFDEQTNAITVRKDASTPSSPDRGVLNVVDQISAEAIKRTALLLHGTTCGLNAIIERKGASVGLLTTAGFRDVLEIRRCTRGEIYNLTWAAPPPLVPRPRRLEAAGRILADGTVDQALSGDDVRAAGAAFTASGIECVAVVFINSHANPEHELEAERLLREAGFSGEIALSHRVSGEYSEYERTSTTVVDAYIRPAVSGYLQRLEQGLRDRGFAGECLVTRSGGGALLFDDARHRPFETVMSGPVAGVAGAVRLCTELGIKHALTADVGGTSFDTSLILNGRAIVQYAGVVDGLPLQTQWVDVRSIGAGGGSIARAEAGLLRVGPDSAGARPGPACYGRGGTAATTTDAAAVLGMLGHGRLAGGLQLDFDAARSAVAAVGNALGLNVRAAAAGIISVATAAMAQAMIEITVERGEDPRDASIVAFGGAGPMFGALLARELNCKRVVIPAVAGNFSAWGLLCEDVVRSTARTFIRPLSAQTISEANGLLAQLFGKLKAMSAPEAALSEPLFEPALDLRYKGQEHTITMAPRTDGGATLVATVDEIVNAFGDEHERQYDHRLELPVEILNVRATVRVPLPVMPIDAAVSGEAQQLLDESFDAYSFSRRETVPFRLISRAGLRQGERYHGPAIIIEETTVTYVDHGFLIEVLDAGALLLTDMDG
jgi:N-methylhydantoinase A